MSTTVRAAFSPGLSEPSPPRVAVVYHFFAHYRGAIIEELERSDRFQFTFFGDDRDPGDSGIRAYEFGTDAPFVHTSSRLFGNLLVQRGVIGLALSKDFECIVYLGDAHYLTTWISAGVARLRGKRVLFWTHGWTSTDGKVKGLLRRAFYREAHALLLYGDRARAQAIREGFDPSRIFVIYNSLDYPLQRALRGSVSADSLSAVRALFPNPDDPLVLFSGRLVHNARVDMIIDALAMLPKEVNLLVVGDGAESASLRRSAAARGVAAVFVGGEYDEARLAEYFMAADVTVSPGKVGLLAIHSLAYGTPVVTHDRADLQMPESEAITPGLTGSLFRYGDTESLAAAIGEWIGDARRPGEVEEACLTVIESRYNPRHQRVAIELAIEQTLRGSSKTGTERSVGGAEPATTGAETPLTTPSRAQSAKA